MRIIYILLLCVCCLYFKANAQVSSFGEVDIADLKLTNCTFEKNASAMVLFDVAKVTNYSSFGDIEMRRHKRIKIFNDKGASQGNIRIEYWFNGRDEIVKDIEAVTYNLAGDKIEKTLVDKKQIYTEKIDKQRRAIIFSFPYIKAGSVIEFRYTWITRYAYNYPNWFFQSVIPTRYSEMEGSFVHGYQFNVIKKITQPLAIDTTLIWKGKGFKRIWAMKNIPGFKMEPYMHSIEDNMQGVYCKPYRSFSWTSIVDEILADEDFGLQLNKSLAKEEEVIAKAKALKTNNQKIAYLFKTVKNGIKWNDDDYWYTIAGVQKAWLKKTGNSTEITLILYHLLKASGINSRLIVLGTRDNGEIEIDNPGFSRLNKTVVQVPIDTTSYYVLDATAKYNTFNNTPYELLGLNMISIDPDTKKFVLIKLQNNIPSEQVVFVNAEIKPSGRLEGSTQLSSSNYKRIAKLMLYDKLGEKKYIEDELKDNDNNIKIDSFKIRNMEIDTFPLREDFNFNLDLTGSDGDYIYFNPNLFTGVGDNPFINDTRNSDIDFVYLNKYVINGRYKIPAGYKVDALPKPISIIMDDRSISFKRTIGELEGAIVVHYIISFGKVRYLREDYPVLHNFYKKMYELLNEQVVLKKQ